MIEPLTEREQTLTVTNVLRACQDIEALNRRGYNFLYLASGFIAHYDINGFKAYYSSHSLEADILANARANNWLNFSPEDENYAYYMSKRAVYQRILAGINYASQREYAE
jgi:hypothetical protein